MSLRVMPDIAGATEPPERRALRTMRVTMGAVSTPARRPEDAAGDADVLRRIRAGDPSAIDDLYERFRRPAFALARRILADDVLAEDVLQEVFLSVWRDPSAYERGRGSVASWLLAVVHHKAVDAVRREESQRRRQALAEEDLALDEPIAARDVEDDAWTRVVSERVRTALGGLLGAQREALTLAYYGGYTQREVAALTGTPLGTVKTRMLSGMRRLKQELGGAAPDARRRARCRRAPEPGDDRRPTSTRLRRARRRLGAARPRAGGRGRSSSRTCAGCDRCATTVAETDDVMAAMATDLPAGRALRGAARPDPRRGRGDRAAAAAPPAARPAAAGVARPPRGPAGRVRAGARRGRRAALAGWRRALPLGWSPRPSPAIVGLGIWNVVLTSDRRRAAGDRRRAERRW